MIKQKKLPTNRKRKRKTWKWIIIAVIIIVVLPFIYYLLFPEKNNPERLGIVNKPNDTRLDNPDLLYVSISESGLCRNSSGVEGGCSYSTFLYSNGKYIGETGWDEYQKKKIISPTEKQISPEMLDKIILEIRNSGIMNKSCPPVTIMDASFYYQINLDGVKKIFPESPQDECRKTLNNIDILISSFVKTDNLPFFDFINSLNNFPNLSSENISGILHVNLSEDSKNLEPYYTVKTAKGNDIAGFFKSVELRTPKENSKGGLLIMDLKNNSTITEKDVLNIYPDAIPELKETTSPIPYDYKVLKPWGKISYQITRDSSKRVVTVILDSLDK